MSLAATCNTDFQTFDNSKIDCSMQKFLFRAKVNKSEYVEFSFADGVNCASKSSVLSSALALGRAEEVCQFIESLLELDLHFLPAEDTSEVGVLSASLVLTQESAHAEVALSSGLMPLVASNWTKVDTARITLNPIETQLIIDRFPLDDEDKQRLVVGSLVLIPGSYRTKWCCRLVNSTFKVEVICSLNKHRSILIPDSEKQDNRFTSYSNTSTTVEIRLDREIPISPVNVKKPTIGEHNAESPALDTTISLPELHGEKVNCTFSNGDCYTGSLVCVGDGFAVFIEERL